MTKPVRIGIDLGGTKISAMALGPDDRVLTRKRIPAPRHDYPASVAALTGLVGAIEAELGVEARVGICMPGSISPATGRVQNANDVDLNGKPLRQDLEAAMGRTLRMANDADCFALSEAIDGAGRDAHCVFGVILGTGCGGGIVIGKALLQGPHFTTGEWGHMPLPWATTDETPGPSCWCGRRGCLEQWVSGTGLAADHERKYDEKMTAVEIAEAAARGEPRAMQTLKDHHSRLARALAVITNILDPDMIVLGGGLSNIAGLYDALPPLMAPLLFADHARICIRPPVHGDDSGVRGAAWLWN